VKDSKVAIEWEVEYHEDTDDVNSADEQAEKGYTLPEYIFVLECTQPKPTKSADSGVLEVKGWIKTEVRDIVNNNILKAIQYTLLFPDGSKKDGETDENGYINEADLKFTNCTIIFKREDKNASEN